MTQVKSVSENLATWMSLRREARVDRNGAKKYIDVYVYENVKMVSAFNGKELKVKTVIQKIRITLPMFLEQGNAKLLTYIFTPETFLTSQTPLW